MGSHFYFKNVSRYRTGFLSLGSIDSWGQIILLGGLVQCIAGRLAATLGIHGISDKHKCLQT